MAEVIGTVSACIGIFTFALQISNKINDLKYLCKQLTEFVSELEVLSARLELFRMTLEKLEPFEKNPTVQFAVQQSSKRFHDVEIIVQKLQRKLLVRGKPLSGPHNKWRLLNIEKRVLELIQKANKTVNEMSGDITLQVSLTRPLYSHKF